MMEDEDTNNMNQSSNRSTTSSALITNSPDSSDQDSLDEKIDSEQRLRNHLLWASFQNTASCITKLYNHKTQPTTSSPWVPFQNAASNLATLYKDCIDSQKRFAKLGYQHGRRRKMRDLKKLLMKNKIPTKVMQKLTTAVDYSVPNNISNTSSSANKDSQEQQISLAHDEQTIHNSSETIQQQQNPHHNTTNVSSILNVNQLNLGSNNDAINPFSNISSQPQQQTIVENQQQANLQILLGNTEDDLFTFQQALTQPTFSDGRVKISNQQHQHHHNRRHSSNYSGCQGNPIRNSMMNETIKSEEERLFELNQFLSEEYHRHVGSRKRSCSNLGGDAIKRLRE